MPNLGGKPLKEIPLPAGWDWYALPNATDKNGVLWMPGWNRNNGTASYRSTLDKLKDWLVKYELGAISHSTDYLIQGNYTFYATTYFKVQVTVGPKAFLDKYYGPVICSSCERENPAGTYVCTNRQCREPMSCRLCGQGGLSTVRDGTVTICIGCAGTCGDCGKPCDPNFRSCSTCKPRARCKGCRAHIQGAEINTVPYIERNAAGGVLRETPTPWCNACVKLLCGYCNGRGGNMQYAEQIDKNVCRSCFDKFFDVYKDVREDFEPDELPATKLVVPSMAGRERVRDVGVEIEGGGNGNVLSKALHAEALVPWANQTDRHGVAGTHSYPAHIEYDASVDWEMVIAKFNPSKLDDMRKVNNILKIAREQVKAGECHLDLRCGCHIHVDAHKINMKDAFNLWGLFAYIEDPIFRIGSAKWDVHRTVKYGRENGASVPVPKGPYRSVMEFGNALRNGAADRYFALSFANFWRGVMGHCVCGAIAYGQWEDCTCDLGKCTFEFRVFNSTLNPRKLHAYIALSQALVAKAVSMPEIDVNKFPPMEWDVASIKKLTEGGKAEKIKLWTERLTFMFTELPLTADEKESLAYCVRNSSMAELLDEGFLSGLARESVLVAV